MISWAQVITEDGLTMEQVYALYFRKPIALYYYDFELQKACATTDYDLIPSIELCRSIKLGEHSPIRISEQSIVLNSSQEWEIVSPVKTQKVFARTTFKKEKQYQELKAGPNPSLDICYGVRFHNGAPLTIGTYVLKAEWNEEEQTKKRNRVLAWFDPADEIGKQAFEKRAKKTYQKIRFARSQGRTVWARRNVRESLL